MLDAGVLEERQQWRANNACKWCGLWLTHHLLRRWVEELSFFVHKFVGRTVQEQIPNAHILTSPGAIVPKSTTSDTSMPPWLRVKASCAWVGGATRGWQVGVFCTAHSIEPKWPSLVMGEAGVQSAERGKVWGGGARARPALHALPHAPGAGCSRP